MRRTAILFKLNFFDFRKTCSFMINHSFKPISWKAYPIKLIIWCGLRASDVMGLLLLKMPRKMPIPPASNVIMTWPQTFYSSNWVALMLMIFGLNKTQQWLGNLAKQSSYWPKFSVYTITCNYDLNWSPRLYYLTRLDPPSIMNKNYDFTS